ncbi:FxLYD domain-containing protein [Natronobiforma cellulositropha]|uniref:FxLYD domain-containing protein n=1 Tax=Natronobiforma cellulositropha TaxID=1679076 RepID=UPI0021D59500|nr:FxLYD domain-containing protein [Natronobiforma cellulositropha]
MWRTLATDSSEPTPGGRCARRTLLCAFGAGTLTALAGCGAVENDPVYESGPIDGDGPARNASETVAARALAETDANEGASPLGRLTVEEHAFILESGYEGATVQGVVGVDERVEYAEVRVRVYDADGDQRGRYLDSTGDLAGGSRWRFSVILLESPADLERYDVAVLGVPA